MWVLLTRPESLHRPADALLVELDPTAWGNRSNSTGFHIILSPPEQISIYASAGRRYTLRTDGFMSIHANYDGGGWATKPLIFTGKKLVSNSLKPRLFAPLGIARSALQGHVVIAVRLEHRVHQVGSLLGLSFELRIGGFHWIVS